MRTIITKNRDFNLRLAIEQLYAALTGVKFNCNFAGFIELDLRIHTPAPGPKIVSKDYVKNIELIAQPGEIFFYHELDFTPAQLITINTVLDTHDEHGTTAIQAAEDQDEIDLDYISTGNISDADPGTQREMLNRMQRLIKRRYGRD